MLKDGDEWSKLSAGRVRTSGRCRSPRPSSVVCVWGASFIATKIALAEVQAQTVVWLRFAMGVAVRG